MHKHLINLSDGSGDNALISDSNTSKESQILLKKNFRRTVQLNFHNKALIIL